jgi:hypothetical protein
MYLPTYLPIYLPEHPKSQYTLCTYQYIYQNTLNLSTHYVPTYLPTYQPIYQSTDQFSSGPTVAVCSGPTVAVSSRHSRRFKRRQLFNFPATSSVPLPFPTSLPAVHTFPLHPLSCPLSPHATRQAPRTPTVHIISTQYSPFHTKSCCSRVFLELRHLLLSNSASPCCFSPKLHSRI